MINYKLNQIEIHVTDPEVIAKFKQYVVKDKMLQNAIENTLFNFFLSTNAIWNPVDGWYKNQPDRIVLYIPVTVYPERIVAEPETVITASINDDDLR